MESRQAPIRSPTRSPTRRQESFSSVVATKAAMREIVKMATEEEKKRAALEERPKKWPCYILRPDSKPALASDILTTIALVGVFLVVPFELAFVESPDGPLDPLAGFFIFNRIIDSIFWLEMGITFFRAYARAPIDDDLVEEAYNMLEGQSTSDDVLASAHSFEWRLSQIALHYAKGWLLMDVISSIPSVLDIAAASSIAPLASEDGLHMLGDDSSSISMLRITRRQAWKVPQGHAHSQDPAHRQA